ncbi:SDR family NAD(P)-dependent oxidoreductase [Parachryseolinea silvisoli]|uniref:SDR family NAD(P)-dependent oxidoreductase n=1 Tax=Parachryseolinea silvisoli TaxID=2873601 RepID=UPI002265B490|nr:SDR family oxidoreductase [Parachryseolinea silvisoli]MCD9018055.1 SDR family oxidoreductase [Parachryseolinea silvisoli]
MDLQLKQKTAFISGSTQGIGFAIAQKLAEEGAMVIINGKAEDRTQQAVHRLRSAVPGAQISGVAADFANVHEIEAMLKQLPTIDILINNVGIFELKPFADIDDATWTKILEVNLLSGVRVSRALFPAMLKKGWGRILFISSESGVNVPADMIHYGVTKTAMLSLSNGLSKLTKGTAVTVNSILGGPTYSDGVAQTVEQLATAQNISADQMKAAIIQHTNPNGLLQRFITPEEIANVAAYLSSPLAAAINGASVRADGGTLQVL